MKLASFRLNNRNTWGAIVEGGVADLGAKMSQYPTLRSAIKAGALGEIKKSAATAKADAKIDAIAYLPLIPDVRNIWCVGVNYHAHREEMKRDISQAQQPTIFTRTALSQVGHLQPMIRPKVSDKYDFEGELAVIIGATAHNISKENALSVVAGYSCYNDGSIRDWQRHTTQFAPGKNFNKSGAFGPWMVTADEIPDPQSLTLETRLNGEVVQHTTTDLMIFDVRYIINYISTFTTLKAGDVIITGTPGGVGAARTPPLWMKGGDTIEVEISSVGLLKNPIKDE